MYEIYISIEAQNKTERDRLSFKEDVCLVVLNNIKNVNYNK